jgi:hypothetical protein
MTAKRDQDPAGGAGEMFAAFNSAVTEAGERNRTMLQAGFGQWSGEAERFFEQMAAQGAMALEQLKACKTPLEMLSVEQAWLAKRSKAYLDVGARFAQIFGQGFGAGSTGGR